MQIIDLENKKVEYCYKCKKKMIRDNNGHYQCYNCGIDLSYGIWDYEKTKREMYYLNLNKSRIKNKMDLKYEKKK